MSQDIYRLQWWIQNPVEASSHNTLAAWIPEAHELQHNHAFGKYLGRPIDLIGKKLAKSGAGQ